MVLHDERYSEHEISIKVFYKYIYYYTCRETTVHIAIIQRHLVTKKEVAIQGKFLYDYIPYLFQAKCSVWRPLLLITA